MRDVQTVHVHLIYLQDVSVCIWLQFSYFYFEPILDKSSGFLRFCKLVPPLNY